MAQTSVHIKAAKSGALEHNERTRKLNHVRADLTPNNQNWHASGYSGNADLLAEIKADYQDAHGKKLHAKATPVREGVVVIQKDTTMAQLLTAARRCEQEFGIQVQAISMHMDEGHYQEGPTPLQNGPWVGNYHAHVTWCWYNWQTHTTCKLDREDTARMQTIFAEALAMERGLASTKKGLSAIQFKVQKKQEQLAALEQQGKLASARATKLQAEIATLQEKEAAALEKVQAAEKAASREQLRSNAADIGARVLGLFGRGAVAEANAERDQAQQAAAEAEQQAAADRQARQAAEQAQKQAEMERTAAESAARRAKADKDAYGRERYEAGQAEGYTAGRRSMAESIAPLQQQLAAKQDALDRAVERAEAAEKELEDMVAWNPNMRNWRQSVKDMRAAGMNDNDIQQVFKRGQATVQINIKHNYKDYPVETTVAIGTLQTAANKHTFGVWFKAAFDNAWHGVRSFLEKAQQHIRQLHPSRGPHL